jgi:hypothetical protein
MITFPLIAATYWQEWEIFENGALVEETPSQTIAATRETQILLTMAKCRRFSGK